MTSSPPLGPFPHTHHTEGQGPTYGWRTQTLYSGNHGVRSAEMGPLSVLLGILE